MSHKDIHVVPHQGDWAVKSEGSSRATRVTATKVEAMAIAREMAIARGAEVVEHRADGRICGSDSYGHDPCPPLDKEH